jgi:undecaprenyl-diphosphatase
MFTLAPLRVALAMLLVAPIVDLDRRVQSLVQSGRRPALEPVMHGATDIGKGEVVLGTLLGIALFSGPAGPLTARAALVTMIPTNLAVEGLKRGINRARPDGEHRRSNASFPSSHAANAFAFAAVFSRRWPRVGFFLWPGAALVAWSRVYLNRHFLSDVLVGAAIGVAGAWLVMRWLPVRHAEPSARTAATQD